MQISGHFQLHEFTDSPTAARMGIDIVATPEQEQNVARLCAVILEPIRMRLGRAIVITSGIRPTWLNDEVGGASNSAHLTGRAADINAVGMSALTFFRWLKNQPDIPYDKVILEFAQWVHVQIPDRGEKPRGQFLIASHRAGNTVYEVAA